MSKPEVLPCPFCGAEPLMREIEPHTHSGPLKALGIPDHPGSHVIECGCGAGMIAEAKQAVRDMWNRRKMYSYVQPRAGVPDVAGYDVFESESCSHVLLLPEEIAKVRLRLSASATALIRLTDHESARAADKARIAELEKRNEGLLGLYREAESELKQCVIDRASFSDELRACTESPGGCGYWREAAKHRTGERDHALARIAELEKERDEWHRLFDSAGQLSKNACDDLNSAKSRIAELVLSLRTVVGMLHHRATTPLERQAIRIAETALAQQGKEGEA